MAGHFIANKASGVVYDRSADGHEGTGIVMLRIRKRLSSEKPRRKGGKLYSKEVVPGWIVDFDGDDQPIEIEILNPAKHFPQAILDILPSEFIKKK